jgi:hypothetical protein
MGRELFFFGRELFLFAPVPFWKCCNPENADSDAFFIFAYLLAYVLAYQNSLIQCGFEALFCV